MKKVRALKAQLKALNEDSKQWRKRRNIAIRALARLERQTLQLERKIETELAKYDRAFDVTVREGSA